MLAPTLTITEVTPELITDDLVMELLNPTEPALMRMVASFHLSAVLRHTITLITQGEQADAHWLADMRSSIAALQEVLGLPTAAVS